VWFPIRSKLVPGRPPLPHPPHHFFNRIAAFFPQRPTIIFSCSPTGLGCWSPSVSPRKGNPGGPCNTPLHDNRFRVFAPYSDTNASPSPFTIFSFNKSPLSPIRVPFFPTALYFLSSTAVPLPGGSRNGTALFLDLRLFFGPLTQVSRLPHWSLSFMGPPWMSIKGLSLSPTLNPFFFLKPPPSCLNFAAYVFCFFFSSALWPG